MAEVVRGGTRRPDRRRPAVDLRPVPAAQDRGGPLRRDARVHRLQRLLLALDLGPPPRLHPERDRRRGAPPRLAPGALRPGRRTPTRRRSWSGAGPAGMECAIVLGASAASSSSTSSTPATTSAASLRWVTRLPGLGEWGQVDRLPAGPDRAAGEPRVRPRARRWTPPAVREYGADDRRRGDRRALGRRRHERDHAGADPGRRRVAPARAPRPRQVMVEGVRPAGRRVAIDRLRGLLHGAGAGRGAARPRARGDARDLLRRRRADLRPDPRGRARCAVTCTTLGIDRAPRAHRADDRPRRAAARATSSGGRVEIEADAVGARHAADVRRRALPGARRRSRGARGGRDRGACTGSATASPRG